MIPVVVGFGLLAFLLLREQKAKYPHSMFDCATGKEYIANTPDEHEEYAALGYVHKMSECKIQTPDPIEPTKPARPDPAETKWTDTATWSGESSASGSGGEYVVWFYTKGIRFQDGSTQMSDSTYIVIGNKTHTAFQRANSERGTIDIPKRYSGGEVDMNNVIVYASLEDAEAKADLLANPPARDPNDPVQPQPQPEDDEGDSGGSGGFGGLPPQQGRQLGQGYGSSAL